MANKIQHSPTGYYAEFWKQYYYTKTGTPVTNHKGEPQPRSEEVLPVVSATGGEAKVINGKGKVVTVSEHSRANRYTLFEVKPMTVDSDGW